MPKVGYKANKMKEVHVHLANIVRKERRMRDLKQENIAEELKLSQSGYNKIERGLHKLDIETWSNILNHFGLKLSDELNKIGL